MKIDDLGLNPAQKEAVTTLKGSLLVLAGAGTGKTRVITYRITNLLKNWVAPDNILALTFTNKAAREMRERVEELVGRESARKIFLGTFHSFCIRLLRLETKHTYLHPGFTIADDVDQGSIFKQVTAELGVPKEDINLHRYRISNAKNDLIFPEGYMAKIDFQQGKKLTSKIYTVYQDTLKMQNMVDFDDILMVVVKMFEEHPKILKKYQEIYQYLLVDEFQDTNQVQFRLIELLGGESANICVVGDDDQSIYGWRGAKVDNILNFPSYFKNTKVVKLEENYRSTNTILEAANCFISGNEKRHDKSLWSKRGKGKGIIIQENDSDMSESSFVAHDIYRTMVENSKIQYKDIALLYRSNHQSRLFEQELRKEGIPYRLVGSKSFFDRKEIRDAVAYLKLLVNPKDDQSLLRIIGVPSRGIGPKAIEILRNIQNRKRLSLCELLGSNDFAETVSTRAGNSAKDFFTCISKWRSIFNNPGDLADKTRSYFAEIGFLNGFQKMYKNFEEAEKRKENVGEFLDAIAQFEDGFTDDNPRMLDFLENFSLADDNDKVDEEEENGNAVTLLTVHASKGLEYPVIYVVGMEHGIFPHQRSLDERDVEEERRLFYVAITRAKDKLVLSYANSRYRFGRLEQQFASNFLDEIPEELLEDQGSGIPVGTESVDKAFENFFEQFEL